MKTVQYRYTVKARVQLTAAEIYHLIDLSLSHYDPTCKSAARPGPGALLNAFKNTIGADGTSVHSLSARELDLLGKILEGSKDRVLQAEIRECWKALQVEGQYVEQVMQAVRNPEPFQESEVGDDMRTEPLRLMLEEVQFARHLARKRGEGNFVIPDQCIALGVLAAYLDEPDHDEGVERFLNLRELRALQTVVAGHSLESRIEDTIQTLLVRKYV